MKPNEVRELSVRGCIVPLQARRQGETPRFWIGWGEPRSASEPSKEHLSVYAPDFFLMDPKPWRLFPFSREVTSVELRGILRAGLAAEPSPGTETRTSWDGPKREDFQEMFSDLQARLRSGELKKAVPVVFSESATKFGALRKTSMLLRALETAERFPVHVYGFWNDEEGMLGATPELLFHSPGDKLVTMALAGTRPHANERRLPLLEDPKELEEHRLVIDGIASALSGWGDLRIGETRELRLQKFSHLHTPIELRLRETPDFEEIARALHPTPALGAWPKDAGMRWLRELERFGPRRRFGAPFGAVSTSGDSVCWVAIRGVQWFRAPQNAPRNTRDGAEGDVRLLVGAGCGVTAQSELAREWEELGLKLESSKAALAL